MCDSSLARLVIQPRGPIASHEEAQGGLSFNTLIDNGWTLFLDDQHQSLSLKGSLRISRVM